MSAFPSTSFDPRPDLAVTMQEFPLAMAKEGIIGSELFPTIEVDVQAGNYGTIPNKEITTPASAKRNSDGTYQRMGWEFDDLNFKTEEFGIEIPLDERRANMYREFIDAERFNAELSRFKTMQADEIRKAAIAMNVANFSGQTNGAGTAWTNHTTSSPKDNIHAAKMAVYAREGVICNVGWSSWERFEDMRMNSEIIAAIEASGSGQPAKLSDITVEMVANAVGLERLLVGGMVKNTANINQNKSIASIWDNTLFGVGYIDLSNNPEMPSLFRQFHWGADGSQIGGVIESYEEARSRSVIHRCRHEVDEQQVVASMGQLITGVAV